MKEYINIEALKGKTLTRVNTQGSDQEILFTCTDGSEYKMYHAQDCCESVYLESITGDLEDLLNSPITEAREDSNTDDSMGKDISESFTWTFYHLATIKGWVTLRWLGESNGYYSEGVDFVQLTPTTETTK